MSLAQVPYGGVGEATQKSAMAETTNTFKLEGQMEVVVLLDPRAGIIQQKLKSLGSHFDWSWSQRGDSATVKDTLEMERITLAFQFVPPCSIITGPHMGGT